MSENFLRALGLPGDWEAAMQAIESGDQKIIDATELYRYVAVFGDPSGCCVGLVDTTTGFPPRHLRFTE
ncbi:hypothetical protein [Corynebacterium sp. H113]|uniref:hypothetical protein n=1 Tax=Corynebacterium sp. H113 TaxID=3133419 RepID=UPI0030A23B44